jgi:hypothetical protein
MNTTKFVVTDRYLFRLCYVSLCLLLLTYTTVQCDRLPLVKVSRSVQISRIALQSRGKYAGRLKSSWTHFITPSLNFVQV